VVVLVALVLTLAPQPADGERARAVELARAGRSAEALAIFERLSAGSADDVDAQLWVARLHARLGSTALAEEEFRAVLHAHPSDIDAHIGLGGVLLRRGEWRDALALLTEIEPAAGESADLFAVLGRAYHRAGDDRRALEYYTRAEALSPTDVDVRYAYEDIVELYRHAIAFEGFGEHVGPSTNAASGTLTAGLRLQPRLRVDGIARVQDRAGETDFTGGGSVEWRAGRADIIHVRAVAGSGNVSLPNADVGTDLIHYAGPFEIGGAVRGLWFTGVDVVAASPTFAWDNGRWRSDARYTYSHSSFHDTGQTSGDHSVLLRETWRPRFRLNVSAGYAYGIESFEDLTADRIGALGATTASAGVRIRLAPMTQIFATWEHQWRSNDTRMDRVTLAVVRSFP